jgi:PAS domain S-box-containing protein
VRKPGLNVQLVAVNGILLALITVAFTLMLGAIDDLRSSGQASADERQLILAGKIERRVIDLENGQRGYAITGEPDFLAPRNQAVGALPMLEHRLLALEADGQSLSRVAELRELFALVSSYIHDYSARVVAAARRDPAQARAIIAKGEGRRRVAEMRRRFSAYSAMLEARAVRARSSAEDSANQAIVLSVICLLALVLGTAVRAMLVAFGIVRPLRRFAKAARELSADDLAVRVPEEGVGEVRVLGQALNSMAASLQSDRDELEAQQAELEQAIGGLSAEHNRIRRFHDFVARLAGSRQLAALGETMLEDLCRLAEADGAALFVIDARGDGETEQLWLASTNGFSRNELPAVVRPGEGPPGRALLEGHAIQEGQELHLPIIQGEEILGLVSLVRSGEAPFEDATVEELEQLMHSAAAALATALSLRAAESAAELNRAILNSAHDAYMATNQEGILEAWSPQAASLYGYTEEEAVGRSLDELLLPEESRPEHRRRHARILGQTEAGSHLEQIEIWTRRKDGRRLLAEISMALARRPPRPLVTYFANDITERRRQEEARRAEEGVSRALAEADAGEDVIGPILSTIGESLGWAYGAFWEYDERDRRLRCTQVWSGEGDEAGDVEHFSLNATVDPEGAAAEFALLRQAWESGEARWSTLGRVAVASERGAALLALGVGAELMLPVRASEGKLGMIEFGALSTEPPDSRTLESLRSITDLIGQVVERRRAVEEADRLKAEFFALVSHELRTPLTSVTGYLDIVRDEEAGAINQKQRHYLDVIHRNTQRLQRLVGDLLFAAQVEAGTLSLERGPVDLGPVVRASIEAALPRADELGVLLAAEIDPMTMESGDADRLGQLIDNLVSNALKFTPEKGEVTVRARRIEGDRALIEVADTGMGISAEDQEHLFERFYRADTVIQRAIPGIGLGLSICQAIAEGHGGSIGVRSEVGRGAAFQVELPLSHPLDESSNTI